MIKIEPTPIWTWIYHPKLTASDIDKITGKYLFFSKDKTKLIDIAVFEILNNGFLSAKVNTYPRNGYVLCLYYKNDSRKHELAERYKNKEDIEYRYWKSDEDTHKGVYSEQYIK